MTQAITPRPCPFCGGTDLYMDDMQADDGHVYHFWVCRDCWAEGPMCAVLGPTASDAADLATRAWNGDIVPGGVVVCAEAP